ncbi:MAG: hypothetical protein KKD59_04865 [Acidobacteria bacterium]|nr:hypothetical protein [Acidobacteriota bacterium]MBU4496064.1 hypothetical protein [Acidobacteriota bacterium]
MFKRSKWVRSFCVGLILGLVLLTAVPALEAAAVCEGAYKKCLTRALLSSFLSMNLIQLFYSAVSCSLGYEFCLLYYETNR